MRIQVLGPISAWREGKNIDLGATRQRAVLGLLALAGGQPLSRAELIEALWDDRPPSSAVNVIQTYLKHLRRSLEPARPARTKSAILPAVGDGYALRLPVDGVDVLRFRQLVTSAGLARRDGDPHRAAALLGEGLAMWQGAPLCDVPFLTSHPKVVSLAGERQTALVRYGELMIANGAASDTVAALEEAAAAQPLDEAVKALLIRAYLAVGQRSRAFAVYHETRSRLAEELGVDPGPDLTATYAELLRDGGTPAVLGSEVAAQPADANWSAPAQLPADVSDFTGRTDELTELDKLLAAGRPAEGDSTAPVITVISGTAGVGKTALAVRWAQRMRDRFPHGQLFVNLRGYDADQPLPVGDVLTRFLTALGVPNQDVPLDVDDRAARYRTEIASRRMLIVLDNAATVEQVRPLLPGTPACVVVVTSRDSLAGLVARHGARRIELDLLPLGDAVTLLRRLIGGKAEAEPEMTATLAEQCARLPLGLRVAAELAVTRGMTLSGLVEGFADQLRRLDMLDQGPDQQTAIRAVFSRSYQHLPADAARAFRLLALHPGADLDPYAAAALLPTGLDETRRILEVLSRASLIQRTGPDRYGMHDLLRAYATQQNLANETGADRRAAFTRLFDYFLATAAAAVNVLAPAAQHHRNRIARPDTPMPPLSDAATARAWLETERATLVAISSYTASHGWPTHTARLAAVLYRYLDGGHYTDALTVYTEAARAAQQAGDHRAQAHALINLGSVYRLRGRYHVAFSHYRHALALHRRAGDARGQARALTNLGSVLGRLGRHALAIKCQRRALDRFRQAGDQSGEARALTNLGILEEVFGRYESAREHHQQALRLYRAIGDRVCEAVTLSRSGLIDTRLGRTEPTTGDHYLALVALRETGHRRGEAHVLVNLGEQMRLLGRHEPAIHYYRQALDLFREIGHRYGEAAAHNGLGESLRATGKPDDALTHHTVALAITVETSDWDEQARAHSGLADTHQFTGKRGKARQHWQQALTLYTALGAPGARDARASLTALDQPPESACQAG